MKKGEEEYQTTDAYKKYVEDLKRELGVHAMATDEGWLPTDQCKNDPEGWRAYVHAAEGQDELCLGWATTAVAQVTTNPMLTAKCL